MGKHCASSKCLSLRVGSIFLGTTFLMILLTVIHGNFKTLRKSDSLEQEEMLPAFVRHVNTSHRCQPFPLTFPPHANLFSCDWDSSPPFPCGQRLRVTLECDSRFASIKRKWVKADAPPVAYDFNDPCLSRVILKRCYDNGRPVPRVVHFVTFRRRPMKFYTFLSVLSAVRFVQPCMLLFHADYLPYGHYWDLLLILVPHIVHVRRRAPTAIFGNVINIIEHSSDVARLEAMQKYGGVYMDTDHILLNPLHELRNNSVVMGIEIPDTKFGNGMFLGMPGAKFFKIWYESYHSFNDEIWDEHSTIVPYLIYKEHPNIGVKVVNSFFTPNYEHIREIFYLNFYDWTKLYGMHLYYNANKDFFKGRIGRANSSLGEITRYILFGRKDACVESKSNYHLLTDRFDT